MNPFFWKKRLQEFNPYCWYDTKNSTFVSKKRLPELNFCWTKDSKNWTFFSMTQNNWTFFQCDSKNWTFFFPKSQIIEPFLNMTQRILFDLSSIWPTDLNPSFQSDSQNWTHYWTLLFQHDSNKSTHFFWTWLKGLNPFFWTRFKELIFQYDSRIEPCFEFVTMNWIFFETDSNNWALFLDRLKD